MTSTAYANPPGLIPTARQVVATVVEHELLAKDTYRLRLRCPEIARQIVPGQFFMVRPHGGTDPLLGRPFALFDTYEEQGKPVGLDFGYLVVGKLTSLMTHWKPGDSVEIWGPLGNGFPPPPTGRLMMVAGGIGQTPFLAVAREALGLKVYPERTGGQPSQVTLCYGVRSAEYLAGLDDFTIEGLGLRIATDDGSRGHHGYVTELLQQSLHSSDRPDVVYCCGPEPMMHRVSEICAAHGVPCWLSLETPMACGIGACFSCVVRIRQEDGSWDFRRSCLDGPVFRAETVVL